MWKDLQDQLITFSVDQQANIITTFGGNGAGEQLHTYLAACIDLKKPWKTTALPRQKDTMTCGQVEQGGRRHNQTMQ